MTILASSLWLAAAASYATLISTGGGSFVQSFGKTNTQTYGQTVTADDSVLSSFSFWLGPTSTNFPTPSNPSLNMMAYVYAWDDALSMATGPALYTSGVFTHNATPSSPFTEYVINTGGVSVSAGSSYALFFSTSGLSGSGRIQWEAATSDAYAGGNFVFLNNGEDLTAFTSSGWGQGFASDLRFTADFVAAAVPEPSIWALLMAGLLACAGLTRVRRMPAS